MITEENFANVKWYKDDEELKMTRKRNQRLKIVSKDCHHILVIEKCVGSDRGTYSVATNTETTVTSVNVSGMIYKHYGEIFWLKLIKIVDVSDLRAVCLFV